MEKEEKMRMNMKAVKDKAREMHIKPGSMNKKQLIRCIQAAEGNAPCYKTDQLACGQYACCWRSDCKPAEIPAMV